MKKKGKILLVRTGEATTGSASVDQVAQSRKTEGRLPDNFMSFSTVESFETFNLFIRSWGKTSQVRGGNVKPVRNVGRTR